MDYRQNNNLAGNAFLSHHQLTEIHLEYVWKIDLCDSYNYVRYSPKFHASVVKSIVWQIIWKCVVGKVTIYLVLVDSKIQPVEASYQFSIANLKGLPDLERKTKNPVYFTIDQFSPVHNFVAIGALENPKNGLVLGNETLLRCTIQFMAPGIVIPRQPNVSPSERWASKFQENLREVFYSKILSDAILVVGDKEIPVHKVILSARSKVFASMFRHFLKEKKQSRIIITGMDYDVVNELLLFIYTATAPNVKNMAGDLFAAANMYELESLKKMCAKALFESMSFDNAVDVLVLAKLYNSTKLRDKTLDYIFANAEDIMDTPKWKTFNKDYGYLIKQYLKRLGN